MSELAIVGLIVLGIMVLWLVSIAVRIFIDKSRIGKND